MPTSFSRTLMPGLQGAIKRIQMHLLNLEQFKLEVEHIWIFCKISTTLKLLNGKLIQAITLGITEIE